MDSQETYEAMIRRAQAASPEERREILDALVAQFAEAALRWAVRVIEDENAASDAVQDAWLAAYLHLDQLRDGAAFPAWLRQIVVSSSYHAIRRDKPSEPLDDDAPIAAAQDPVEEVEMRERLAHIREAVERLSAHEREVTELFYFAEYSQQEIAEVLGIPLTTVKKRLQYAREHLKGVIQPEIVARLGAVGLDFADEEEPEALPELPLEGSGIFYRFSLPLAVLQPGSPQEVWYVRPQRH
jgi:RNA polymerase sigma factor (sigma-70 family)